MKFVDLGGGDGILKDKSCTALTETKHHNIVIGTENGVYVYDRKNRATSPLPGGEAIEDMKIMGLVGDVHGDIWYEENANAARVIEIEEELEAKPIEGNTYQLNVRPLTPGLVFQRIIVNKEI